MAYSDSPVDARLWTQSEDGAHEPLGLGGIGAKLPGVVGMTLKARVDGLDEVLTISRNPHWAVLAREIQDCLAELTHHHKGVDDELFLWLGGLIFRSHFGIDSDVPRCLGVARVNLLLF